MQGRWKDDLVSGDDAGAYGGKAVQTLLSQRRDNNDKPRKIYDILRRTIKRAKQLSGRQLSDLFDKYRVWNYLYDCYEALHTTGTSYIIEDIDLYIDARKPVTV